MDISKVQQFKVASRDIIRVGGAINFITTAEGKVDEDYIAYAEGLKPGLLRAGVQNPHVTVLTAKLLEGLNYAIQYANGDKLAKQRCLDACRIFDKLIQDYNKGGV